MKRKIEKFYPLLVAFKVADKVAFKIKVCYNTSMNLGVETETMEFKKSTAELRAGVESLSSMLNKNGYGVLYFGVKDNGDIVGQQIGKKTLRDISLEIANHIKPQVIPTITHKIVDEKDIVKVEVSGNEKPYSAYEKYFMRSADEDRALSPSALKELMLKKESSDAITQIVSPNQELKFSQLKNAFATKGLTISNATFEKNLGLKTRDGKYNLMAFLLADENDISIKVVTFSGKDKTKMTRRNEYGGKCLINSIDQVLSYIESIDATEVKIGTHRREEEKLFDFAAFKEAWQNACLHTKWEKGNPPAVYVFSDRIEIISTGGLPEDLNKEEFFKGISKPVNSKLQKIFGQLGLVEQTGHGVPLIINSYGKQAFDVMENFVNVAIPFSKQIKKAKAKGIPDVNSLNPSHQKILECIKANPAILISQIAKLTDFSESYVRKILSEMKAKNIIRRNGSRKVGEWEILSATSSV